MFQTNQLKAQKTIVFTMVFVHFTGPRKVHVSILFFKKRVLDPDPNKKLKKMTFHDLYAKMYQHGYPNGGHETSRKPLSNHWATFGVPWVAQGHQNEAQGCQNDTRRHQN